jgi:hypothetical protein
MLERLGVTVDVKPLDGRGYLTKACWDMETPYEDDNDIYQWLVTITGENQTIVSGSFFGSREFTFSAYRNIAIDAVQAYDGKMLKEPTWLWASDLQGPLAESITAESERLVAGKPQDEPGHRAELSWSIKDAPASPDVGRAPESGDPRERIRDTAKAKEVYPDYSPRTAREILDAIPKAWAANCDGGRWGPGMIAKKASLHPCTVGRYLRVFHHLGITSIEQEGAPIDIPYTPRGASK